MAKPGTGSGTGEGVMAKVTGEAPRLLKRGRKQRALALWCCYIVGTALGFYAKHVFGLGNYVIPLLGFATALIVPPIVRRFR